LEGDLHFKVRPRVTGYVSTLAGRAERRTGRLDGAVRIGRYTINDPLVALGSGSVGVMGRGLLENFTVTFDMARSRVALSREGDTVDIPSLRGIGAGIEKGREGWVVTHVLPGGPAENAGLRAGDRIVALNGTIEDLRARLDALGNTAEAVTFEVDRGGSRKRLEIPVEVLVE
jgi:S1-C subfamily serine protease